MASRTACLLTLVWLSLLCMGEPAWAQDDWSLTRDAAALRRPSRPRPAEPRVEGLRGPDLIERYLKTLLRDSSDGFALERLRELSLARDGSLEPLAERLRAESERMKGDSAALEVLARLWLGERQSGRAEQALAEANARFPMRAPLVLLRAQVKLSRGDESGAREDYEMVRRLEPRGESRRRAVQGLAELAVRAGELETARALFEENARAEPSSKAAREAFARALEAHGLFREAAAAQLELADRLGGDARASVPVLREAARLQLAANDAPSALTTLSRARRGSNASERAELRELEIDIYRALERLPELAQLLEEQGDWAAAGEVWEEVGDDARAKVALRTRIQTSPRDIDSRERLARALARGGELGELTATYRELVRLAPSEPRYVVALAQLLRDSGDRVAAMSLLEAASARAPSAVALARALAELYGRWGENEHAARELARLARLEPDEPAHMIALGEEALARGDRKQALVTWQRLPRLHRDPGEGQLVLSQVLGDHDFLEEALVSATRAQELSPARFDVHRQRASLLERMGRNAEAETAWFAAMRQTGGGSADEREARQHLVGLWRRQGLTARRLREFEQRLREHPGDAETLWLMAEIYARDASQVGKEVATLERVLALANTAEAAATNREQEIEALRALERAYRRRGDTEKLLEVIERSIVADPASASTLLARAVEIALETYQDEAALRYANRALQLRPNDAKTRKLVGDLYRRRQDLEQAVAAYRLAAELDRKDFDTRVALAQLETARGNVAGAVVWWSEIIRGGLDDALVSRAVRAARELRLDDTQRSGLENTLLQASVTHPQRTIYRRLLIESYAHWYDRLREAVEIGGADASARTALESLSRRALKPLIEALGDADGFQRSTALGFLSVLGASGSGAALMALAEHGDVAAERAQALVALGRIGDTSLVPRLRALFVTCERRLAPFALWALALSEGAHGADTLLAALHEPDAGVRVLAILGLGSLGGTQARAELRRLVHERNPVSRAAAVWALADLEPEAAEALPSESLESSSLLVVKAFLLARHSDPRILAQALLSQSQEVRRAAADLVLRPGPVGAVKFSLLAPRWPFSGREYVASWIERASQWPSQSPDLSRLEELWPTLVRLAQGSLAGERPVAEAALASLELTPSGLVPGSLLGLAPCFPEPLARGLAHELAPALHALAKQPEQGLRPRALVLLLGASATPSNVEVLAPILANPDDRDFPALLAALEARGSTPSHLRSALVAAFDRSPDWTTRLAIARALGTDVGTERLNKEPIALVRAVAQATRGSPQQSRCAGGSAN